VRRTDGKLVFVPAHVDSAAGHRLFKPAVRFGLIDSLCRPGDHVIDVGANVGEYTLQFAEGVGPTGRVTSFEPVPYLAETVAKTARINGHDWVEVQQVALGSQDGTSIFSVERGNSGGSRLGRMEGDFSQIEVRTLRLDTFFAGRPDQTRLDFLKIDVEGFEDKVLLGARETLARFMPSLLIETGFETPEQRIIIHDLLSGLGYDIIGLEVPGGLIEVSWDDYRKCEGQVAAISLTNLLLLPPRRHA